MKNSLSENKFLLLLKKEPLFFLLLASLYFEVGVSFGKIYLFHLIIPVYFLIYSFRKASVSSVLKKEFIPIHLIYLFIVGISVYRGINMNHIIYYIIGYSVFISFCLNKDFIASNFKSILFFLFVLLSLDLTIGSLEVLTDFRFPISHFSEVNHLYGKDYNMFANFDGCSDLNYALSSPTGFHWNQNNYAFVLLLFLPFTVLVENNWVRNISRTFIFLLILATGSRIGNYSSLFTITVLVLFELKRNNFTWIIPILTIAFIFTDGFYYFPLQSKKVKEIAFVSRSVFHDSFPEKCNLKIKSDESRMDLTKKGLILFKQNPIIGSGAGSFEKYLIKENQKKIQNLESISTTSPHNFILELLVDFGAIILLPILLLFFMLIKSIKRDSNIPGLIFILYFLLLIPASIMLSSLVYFLPFYLFLFLVLVYLLNANNKSEAVII